MLRHEEEKVQKPRAPCIRLRTKCANLRALLCKNTRKSFSLNLLLPKNSKDTECKKVSIAVILPFFFRALTKLFHHKTLPTTKRFQHKTLPTTKRFLHKILPLKSVSSTICFLYKTFPHITFLPENVLCYKTLCNLSQKFSFFKSLILKNGSNHKMVLITKWFLSQIGFYHKMVLITKWFLSEIGSFHKMVLITKWFLLQNGSYYKMVLITKWSYHKSRDFVEETFFGGNILQQDKRPLVKETFCSSDRKRNIVW